jgi:hypothetical protein
MLKGILLALSVVVGIFSVSSQVVVSKPSFTFTACNYPSNFVSLGNIRIDETQNSDFAVGINQTIIINAPLNFEFQPNVGAVSVLSGRNLKNENIVITASSVKITYESTGINRTDGMLISGLKIRVLAATSGTFSRSGGTANINGLANGTGVTNLITGQSLPANSYRTVTNIGDNLSWNLSTSWECGVVPPNNGTANVYISPFNGTFNELNSVIFGTTSINSLTIESGANFSPPGGSGSTLIVNGDFTIQSGGYFRQYNWSGSGKNAIEIKGNFINNGEMSTIGSNNTYDLDITFNGSNPQTISGSGTFRMISNGSQTSTLTFNNSRGISLNANFSTQGLYGDAGAVVINGLLTFGSSENQLTGAGSLTLNGSTVLKAPTFYGHYAMTGTKTLGATASIEYTNNASNIGSSNIPILNLYQLTANVGNSGTLTISNDFMVNGVFNLTTGKVNLGTSTLTIGSSVNNKGSLNYSSGVVIGKLKRWFSGTNSGNESGLFPLGNSSGTLRKFVKVEYTQATDGGTLMAEWIPTPMGYNFSNQPVQTSCNGTFEIYNTASGYWSMTPADGITNAENKKYNITLQAQGLLDFVNDCHVTILKRQGTSPWVQSGSHSDNLGDATNPIVARIGASGWSNWGFAGGSGEALPVELISFNANCEEEKNVLKWSTASEHNSYSFEIEVSNDTQNWTNMSSIPAAGFSNEKIDYSYTIDRKGINSYARLKQIDLNGDYSIYGPVSLLCSDPISLSTFPNPSESNSFNTLVRSSHESNFNLKIFDMSTNIVHEQILDVKEGINLFAMNNLNLAPGIYVLELSSENHDPLIYRQIIK